jgi:hydroxyacylglutathione hydrolase
VEKKMQTQSLIIECLKIGPFQVNTYILGCAQTRRACIIDPGGDEDRIAGLINNRQLTPEFILNTHGHRDHVWANADLSAAYNIPVCMHPEDRDFFSAATGSHPSEFNKNYKVDHALRHGETIPLGDLTIQVIHTPGHTRGSVCFLVANRLFSGDTLFVGSAGRTDLPGGDLDTLVRSIKTQITVLPGDTVLLPGHDYGTTPFSTIEREIRENIYITDF